MTTPTDPIPSWQHRLSIVIPAHNEAEAIATTLLALRRALPECEILVVDDGSTDATGNQVRAVPDIRLVRHVYNRGYGAAIKTGVQRARREYVAWFDADGEHRVEDLTALVERIERENLVAVIGERLNPGRSPVRVFGKFLIRLLARAMGVKLGSDLNCGLRVFRRPILQAFLFLLPNGFSASMTSTMVMIARRLPIAFQSVSVRPRIGVSKVKLIDGFSTLLLVLRIIMLFAPLRIFLQLGLGLIGVGLLYSLAIAFVVGRGFPIGGLLLMNAGMLLSMLGLVADQISQIRLQQLDHSEFEDFLIAAEDPEENESE